MEIYKVLNIAGLLFDLTGAVLVFVYTPRHTRKPPGLGIGKIQKIHQGAEYQYQGRYLEQKEWRRIRFGMSFIILGFIFQLLSSILT